MRAAARRASNGGDRVVARLLQLRRTCPPPWCLSACSGALFLLVCRLRRCRLGQLRRARVAVPLSLPSLLLSISRAASRRYGLFRRSAGQARGAVTRTASAMDLTALAREAADSTIRLGHTLPAYWSRRSASDRWTRHRPSKHNNQPTHTTRSPNSARQEREGSSSASLGPVAACTHNKRTHSRSLRNAMIHRPHAQHDAVRHPPLAGAAVRAAAIRGAGAMLQRPLLRPMRVSRRCPQLRMVSRCTHRAT